MNNAYLAGLIALILVGTTVTPVFGSGISAGPIPLPPEITDASGGYLTEVFVGEEVFVRNAAFSSAIENGDYLSIMLVKDHNGFTTEISSLEGYIKANRSAEPMHPWKPDTAGEFTIELFAWKSLYNPSPVGPARTTTVTVVPLMKIVNGASNVNCDGKLVPQFDYKNGIPVLLMQPNSTATVCVTYQILSDWASYPNKDLYPEGIAQFALGIARNECKGNQESYSCSYKPTPPDLFRITAIPNVLNVTGATNGTNFTIMYKIYATPNSKGFYDYSVPEGYCGSYHMAVGYAAPQVKASDFSPFSFLPVPCFFTLYDVTSVRISGMDYTKIVFHL